MENEVSMHGGHNLCQTGASFHITKIENIFPLPASFKDTVPVLNLRSGSSASHLANMWMLENIAMFVPMIFSINNNYQGP